MYIIQAYYYNIHKECILISSTVVCVNVLRKKIFNIKQIKTKIKMQKSNVNIHSATQLFK